MVMGPAGDSKMILVPLGAVSGLVVVVEGKASVQGEVSSASCEVRTRHKP